jgi:hypothetical protein
VARGGRDRTDRLIDEWAGVRRELLGYSNPKLSKDYLGSMRCTLAARRDLHHGGRSGKVEQQWPEFPFRGNAAIVNEVFKRLSEPLQEIMDAHWVATTPRSKTLRADLMGLSVRVYWERVNRVRAAVEGGMAVVESVRTLSPSSGGIYATSRVATAAD